MYVCMYINMYLYAYVCKCVYTRMYNGLNLNLSLNLNKHKPRPKTEPKTLTRWKHWRSARRWLGSSLSPLSPLTKRERGREAAVNMGLPSSLPYHSQPLRPPNPSLSEEDEESSEEDEESFSKSTSD